MSRVDHAVDELQKLIDAAPPGERLGSRSDLTEQLGVAAGTLNQAIRLLQGRGRLQLRPGPGGGLFVASPDPLQQMASDAVKISRNASLRRDAVRVRAALDPLLIEDVMQHISQPHIARINGILDRMREAADRHDHVEFSNLSWEFQLAIADVSEFEFIRVVFRTAVQLVRDETPSLFGPDEDLAARHASHSRLVEAILAKDRALAQSVVEEALSHMT